MIKPPDKIYIYQFDGKLSYSNQYHHPDLLGVWQEENEVFFFFDSSLSEDPLPDVKRKFPSLKLKQKFEADYNQWHGGELKPVNIGGLTISPVWFREKIDFADVIFIDPGVVFGTPNHATTSSCVKAIIEVFSKDKILTVLDMGCGTGILGLVSLKLGASVLVSFDINFLAVKTTLKNLRINGVEREALVFQGKVEDFYYISADLTLANLPFFVIESFFSKKDFWAGKRWVVISGIFPSQVGLLLDRLKEELKDVICHVLTLGDKWPTLIFKVKK